MYIYIKLVKIIRNKTLKVCRIRFFKASILDILRNAIKFSQTTHLSQEIHILRLTFNE